jgi:hypothetical protein
MANPDNKERGCAFITGPRFGSVHEEFSGLLWAVAYRTIKQTTAEINAVRIMMGLT